MTSDLQDLPPSQKPTPLRIPRSALTVVEQIAAILEPLSNKERGFIIRTVIALAMPPEEIR